MDGLDAEDAHAQVWLDLGELSEVHRRTLEETAERLRSGRQPRAARVVTLPAVIHSVLNAAYLAASGRPIELVLRTTRSLTFLPYTPLLPDTPRLARQPQRGSRRGRTSRRP
ncbi:hypothetical protein NKH18_45165 [Streptomyces sp. M10(2022)]